METIVQDRPEAINTSIAQPEQLRLFSDPLYEASLLHKSTYGFFGLCTQMPGEKFRQRMYPNSMLSTAIEHPPMDRHCWISQNNFRTGKNRQSINLLNFGGVYLDFDPAKGGLPKADWETGDTPEERSAILRSQMIDVGLPDIGIIVHSGNGMQVKIPFTHAIPAAAKPRWDALIGALHARTAGFGSDPKAILSTQIMRLVGTNNVKRQDNPDRLVRIVYESSQKTIDFDDLCEQILPFDRPPPNREAYLRAKAWEKTDRNKPAGWKEWATESVEKLVYGEPTRNLWWQRLADLREFAQRAWPLGVPAGHRNQVAWLIANALAWSTPDGQNYWHELCTLMREIAPTLTDGEIKSSASSVYKRLSEAEAGGLYKFSDETLADDLLAGLDADRRDLWKQITDKSLSERQARRGRKSGKVRLAASSDKRQEALQMSSQGMSTRAIAAALTAGGYKVSFKTVANWLQPSV